MSVKYPYQPIGYCENCKFSAPIPKTHYQAKNHPLRCHRVPPTPATSFGDIWSSEPNVQLKDFCAMFEPDFGIEMQQMNEATLTFEEMN